MKKFNLFAFISIVLFSLVILSCKKDDDNSDDDGGFANNLTTGQIEIKGYAGEKDNKISFSATAKKITIDWGDGKIDEVTPNGVGREFSHEYENSSDFQTILVNTEDLTEVDFVSKYTGYSGSIHELRLGNCPKLQELILYSSGFSGSSKYLNSLTVLEINKAESLTTLEIVYTDLTSLDLSGCTALTELICQGNKMTSLDVSKCTTLTSLNCRACSISSNPKGYLTSLNVSGCTALTELYCYCNQLTSLDISGCTALTELDCSSNKLTALNATGCTALTSLDCFSNELTASALNSLFNSLPMGKSWKDDYEFSYTSTIRIGYNPGTNDCDKSIAEKKGWNVYQ